MEYPLEVLRSAAADPASPAWSTIWQQSCHQGTCDPASAALLPWLSTTIAAFPADRREAPLALAGFIAVDATDADRACYADDIAALRTMAVERLPAASDDSAFVYLLQAILGFDGDDTWGKHLDHLNDGEVEVRCPECDEETLVNLSAGDPDIVPGLSGELAERLHAEATQAGRVAVATNVTRLFGRIVCPGCGNRFDGADNVAGAST
ncbi:MULTISPECIES: hypothetical protein [Catenuloplanes]|uniref:Ribosomal protein S27E n=1 Tax=Catenuloplanes niger TaxID=587534 RepID=A0AAE4A0K5_9ACTN|nr:hypothetical protein [Catenuloplanes niger]MDR7327398.1 ribosomal protein S27E [Catenuloplanes niger]